jgi:lipopolysaccharide/colanic/teichoic acid biosynthesis glycosyltransferase
MPVGFRREPLLLFAGDMCALIFSLWATLLVRYAEFPSWAIFSTHLVPFSFLFLLSAAVFLIAGLYEKHTLLVKSKLPETVFSAQIANIAVGAIFFFLVPYFGITPKTNLFIYLFFSTTAVSAWRLYFFPLIGVSEPEPAILAGAGEECADVFEEVNGNNRYSVRFAARLDTAGRSLREAREMVLAALRETRATAIVLPFSLLGEIGAEHWNALMASGIRFIDLGGLYEELFGRVSLPLLDERWFLEERASAPAALYDVFKRASDIILSALALIVLSPLILLVALVLCLEGGSAFIFQKRVGRGNRVFSIIKFRTMLFDDGEDPARKRENRITRIGSFLRRTQIDEIPQFWNVFWGDLSLIGPRPEIPRFVAEYSHVIPYYGTRHLIQPGISGWAQIKHASPPKLRLDVEATKNKLSYDLYYLKHRSFLLDMEIVLRTIKILIARASR